MENFNKTRIKCINLNRRPDRKENIIKLLKNYNLLEYCDFFSGIDGQNLFLTNDIIELFSGNDFGNKKSFIACALSHLTLMKELLYDNTYDNYLILEDDITFCDDILEKINYSFKLLDNTDWDIVYFGYHIKIECAEYQKYKNKELSIIKHIIDDTYGGLFGYLLNKSGSEKIINYIKSNGIKNGIDYLLYTKYEDINLHHYEINPRLIFSDYVDYKNNIDSDIQYNYDSFIF
jgi:GR25 family glycosyltransferase involved in LPS biosynthesis